jgi:uncharacterized protein YutE (UPF0331/DUF86 family)
VADKAQVAAGVAEIRDAVARIREVLPADAAQFVLDRTAREIVVLNLYVALQRCISLSAHWLADAGLDVPAGYRDMRIALAERSVLSPELAQRLAAATGLRNPIAHRYSALDGNRIFAIAQNELGDLLDYCAQIVRAAQR